MHFDGTKIGVEPEQAEAVAIADAERPIAIDAPEVSPLALDVVGRDTGVG
jgi:hypothetical protein